MRPIEFSTKVAYDFERLTGKSYLTEIDELIRDIARVGAAEGGDVVDVGKAVAQMSVVRFVDITFSALVYAHAVQRMPVDFTQRDVAGWLLDNNFTPAWPVANLIIDSLPQAKPGESPQPEGAKKKQTAEAVSTGTIGDEPQPTPE